MARKIDLGKLVKMADDAHAGFHDEANLKQWGTPLSLVEKRWHADLKQKHWDAVEAKVSFNPLRLIQIRLLAHRYLRRFGKYRT